MPSRSAANWAVVGSPWPWLQKPLSPWMTKHHEGNPQVQFLRQLFLIRGQGFLNENFTILYPGTCKCGILLISEMLSSHRSFVLMQSICLLFNANLFSNYTLHGRSFVGSSFSKKLKTFHVCFLLLIFTVHVSKSSQQYPSQVLLKFHLPD